MRIKVLAERCIACDSCSAICSENKHQAIRPKAAGIRVVKNPWAKVEEPVVCHQCRKAPCVAACPTGALYRNPENGTVVLVAGACSGCGVCVSTCPFHAIFIDEVCGTVVKCDLCGGRHDPLCVKVCPVGALSLDAG